MGKGREPATKPERPERGSGGLACGNSRTAPKAPSSKTLEVSHAATVRSAPAK